MANEIFIVWAEVKRPWWFGYYPAVIYRVCDSHEAAEAVTREGWTLPTRFTIAAHLVMS